MSDFTGQNAGAGVDSGFGDDGSDAPAVTFELDLQADPAAATDGPPPSAAPGNIAPPPPPSGPQYTQDQVQEAIRQAQEAVRSANTAVAFTRPYLEAVQQQQNKEFLPRHTSIEQMKADPTADIGDYHRFMEYQWAQRDAQQRSQVETTARLVSSENTARGVFNKTAVGDGNDFDAVRTRYLEPIYRDNPTAKQLFNQILPNDPAVGEYLVGFLHEMHERAGGDMVRMVNGIRHAMAALRSDGRTAQAKVTDAARAQAQRVIRSSDGVQNQVGSTKRIDADWIKHAPDKDFDLYDRQVMGGL